MKKNIHPEYGDSVIECACGNKVATRSTQPRIQVEICSACHPFYTGQKKIVDTAGRVDRFKRRMEKSQQIRNRKKEKAKKTAPKGKKSR